MQSGWWSGGVGGRERPMSDAMRSKGPGRSWPHAALAHSSMSLLPQCQCPSATPPPPHRASVYIDRLPLQFKAASLHWRGAFLQSGLDIARPPSPNALTPPELARLVHTNFGCNCLPRATAPMCRTRERKWSATTTHLLHPVNGPPNRCSIATRRSRQLARCWQAECRQERRGHRRWSSAVSIQAEPEVRSPDFDSDEDILDDDQYFFRG